MKRLALITLLGSSVLLAACGSGSGSDREPRGRLDTDYSNLQLADPTLGPLSNQHPPSDFSEYLRNGVRLMVQPYGQDGRNEADFAESPAADNSAGGGENYSQTNVHVIGVDEADRLKYDGEHLFVAESPYYTYAHFAAGAEIALDDGFGGRTEPPPNQAVRVYRTHPEEFGATLMARYEFERSEENPLTLSELYTLDDDEGRAQSVAALSDKRLYFHWGWGDTPSYGRRAGATRVDLLDVQSPGNPQLDWSIELEGALLNSRKIGDVMYLVTRTVPQIDGVEPYPDSQEERERNEQLISGASIEDLLPEYSVNEGDLLPLVTEENCYLPKGIDASNQGYADLVTVSAIDLRSRELVSSACINAQLSGIYMSLDSLYLGARGGHSSEQQTGLHKFTIAQGEVEYRGTGVVPGHLNWSDPAFSMDEKDGYLRVVTSVRQGWNDFDHYLHVLREPENGDTDQLEVVAKLPNEQQPEAIGKPGEDIFAVRFLGDRAYIVTFEQMDPLYVLDLSNNENPKIVGALEIPGVSTYLHPVGEGYLVSVGEDPMNMEGGVKIELFDVRDDNNPQSLETHMIGGQGSWSEALRDLRAFNFLSVSDDSLRFTLPVTRRENYEWVDSGLHLFEINNLTGEEAVLEPSGSMIVERPQNDSNGWHTNSGNGRSRMHGDTVFYLHGNDIWASDWSDPENVQGPFTE